MAGIFQGTRKWWTQRQQILLYEEEAEGEKDKGKDKDNDKDKDKDKDKDILRGYQEGKREHM